MVHGLLITNAFLHTGKFTEHYVWLSEAAKRQGMSLEQKTNADFFLPFGDGAEKGISVPVSGYPEEKLEEHFRKYDFILYWDKDISLGQRISALVKKYSIPVFNSIEAVELCDDKTATYQRLSEWNRDAPKEEQIPLVPTVMAPMTYQNVGYTDVSFVSRIIDYLGLPLVIKECHGSFGMQVYLAKTEEEVLSYTKKLEGIPFLYQKYVENSTGRDVRLQVVGDRVVAGMYRYSEHGDFRANLSNGGSMRPYEASEREQALAVRAVKALGLDFAGVDLLFSGMESGGLGQASGTGRTERQAFSHDRTAGREEADMLCEVNSNAHFKNIYTCTGVNTADCIMEYIAGRLSQNRG